MSSVESRTRLSIDELIESTVIEGYINETGQLVLVTRGGAELPAGDVSKPFGAPWDSTSTYTPGDTVGYAGTLWRALSGNTNKPPALFNSKWVRLTGESMSDWAEKDPYFDGDSLTESWNVSTTTGSSVPSLTSTTGQFETGIQALKLTMGTTSFQRLFEKEENIVRGGEVVTVQVRAKLLSSAAGVTLRSSLLQNDATAAPVAGASGLNTTDASENPQTLTTSWTTFTFTMTAANAKPRANANVTVTTTAAGAVVLIDYIRIIRGETSFLESHPVGAIFMTNSATNPGTIYGGTWTAWGSGRVPVGVDGGQTEFDTVEETGGAKTVTLTSAEMPTHAHAIDHDHASFSTGAGGSHHHATAIRYSANGVTTGATPTVRDVGAVSGGGGSSANADTSDTTHSHTIDVPAFAGNSGNAGSGGAHNNLQPYITCYMWKRTA